jgi:type II secretory pathway pseudopilin PulG
MTSKRSRAPTRRRAGGFTLIEATMMAAILAIGLAGAAQVVTTAATFSRRNLAQTQAYLVAERELERLISMGCDGLNPTVPCANLIAMDHSTRSVWWGVNGDAYEAAPAAGDPLRREYRILLDVDAPGAFEGAEKGEPDLTRSLAGAGAGNQVNARVQVSWTEQGRPRQVVALQTRIAP